MNKNSLIKQWLDLWLNNQDVEAIILHNTGISKSQYFLVDTLDNSEKIIRDFEQLAAWYPLQYITNTCEFYGRDFYVDKHVLIPRIDTEVLVRSVIKYARNINAHYIDVWTGSWIIPITLALELEHFKTISALDISIDALRVAKKNRDHYLKDDSIHMSQSDILTNFDFQRIADDAPIVITANLPYIKDDDHKNMSKSTIKYEPELALYGGGDGFDLYRKIIIQCMVEVRQWHGIVLFIEIGFDQAEIVAEFCTQNQLDFEFHKDSATIQRVVQIHF